MNEVVKRPRVGVRARSTARGTSTASSGTRTSTTARQFLANPPDQVRRNTAEIWSFADTSGGWDHPIHIHFEEGSAPINGRTGAVADANRYRTDIYRMGGNSGRRDGGVHALPRLPGSRLRQPGPATSAATSCTATTRCTRTTP